MAYELRPGQGTLFQNDQRGNDKAPTHRGELCLDDGQVIKIAGWRKEGRNGPFVSLKIDKPREDRDDTQSFRGGGSEGVAGRGDHRADRFPEVEDDLPFITLNSIR